MADKFRPATGQVIEYKAYARRFKRPGKAPDAPVLYVVATMTYPDSGWRVILVEQEGAPEIWRLLDEEPAHSDGKRTYYIASGSSEHVVATIPKSVTVYDARGGRRIPVLRWPAVKRLAR